MSTLEGGKSSRLTRRAFSKELAAGVIGLNALAGCAPEAGTRGLQDEIHGKTQEALIESPSFGNPTVNERVSWISPDGNEMLFNSTRVGGAGGTDIWRVLSPDGGDTWGTPTLVPNIGTSGHETRGIEGAGKFFYSNNVGHIVGCDDNNNTPINCTELSGHEDFVDYIPTQVDSGYLYFVSSASGTYDIYRVPVGSDLSSASLVLGGAGDQSYFHIAGSKAFYNVGDTTGYIADWNGSQTSNPSPLGGGKFTAYASGPDLWYSFKNAANKSEIAVDRDFLVSCTPTNWYANPDGDAYGAGTAVSACTAPSGHVALNGDCNNNDGAIYPGAPETCNNVDNNCANGTNDEPKNTYKLDQDGDGAGNPGSTVLACTVPGGYVALTDPDDCDDTDPGVQSNCGVGGGGGSAGEGGTGGTTGTGGSPEGGTGGTETTGGDGGTATGGTGGAETTGGTGGTETTGGTGGTETGTGGTGNTGTGGSPEGGAGGDGPVVVSCPLITATAGCNVSGCEEAVINTLEDITMTSTTDGDCRFVYTDPQKPQETIMLTTNGQGVQRLNLATRAFYFDKDSSTYVGVEENVSTPTYWTYDFGESNLWGGTRGTVYELRFSTISGMPQVELSVLTDSVWMGVSLVNPPAGQIPNEGTCIPVKDGGMMVGGQLSGANDGILVAGQRSVVTEVDVQSIMDNPPNGNGGENGVGGETGVGGMDGIGGSDAVGGANGVGGNGETGVAGDTAVEPEPSVGGNGGAEPEVPVTDDDTEQPTDDEPTVEPEPSAGGSEGTEPEPSATSDDTAEQPTTDDETTVEPESSTNGSGETAEPDVSAGGTETGNTQADGGTDKRNNMAVGPGNDGCGCSTPGQGQGQTHNAVLALLAAAGAVAARRRKGVIGVESK